jgi:Family of unknown function (DUF6226)
MAPVSRGPAYCTEPGRTKALARHTATVEEYPRITEPSRYGVLHQVAEALLDELTDRYVVARRDTKEPLVAEPGAPIVRVTRLVPHCPAASPLAILFTDFPGIVLRLGRWFEDRLPACGCDECDERPSELAADLQAHVAAHVEGGLWERVHRSLTGSLRETRLIGPGLSLVGSELLQPAEARSARREGFAAPVQWAPWPRRSPVSVRPG